MSEIKEVVVKLVPHDETVAELDALGDWLADRGLLVARFTGGELERLTLTQV